LGLLEEKTGSLSDVVAVEKALGAVREDIETMEAEQRVLERKVALATVHVSLRHTDSTLWAHPGATIADAFQAGLAGAANLTMGAAVVAAAVAPSLGVLTVAAFVLVVFVRAGRRWRARRAAWER
jgi:hypothetical protein